jgi:hypothetical protein
MRKRIAISGLTIDAAGATGADRRRELAITASLWTALAAANKCYAASFVVFARSPQRYVCPLPKWTSELSKAPEGASITCQLSGKRAHARLCACRRENRARMEQFLPHGMHTSGELLLLAHEKAQAREIETSSLNANRSYAMCAQLKNRYVRLKSNR